MVSVFRASKIQVRYVGIILKQFITWSRHPTRGYVRVPTIKILLRKEGVPCSCMMKIPFTTTENCMQVAMQLAQGSLTGDLSIAVLDTGSSVTVVHFDVLPAKARFKFLRSGTINFLSSKLPVTVIRMRCSLFLGGQCIVKSQRMTLHVARDTLPHGRDCIIGLCMPYDRSSIKESMLVAASVRRFAFDFVNKLFITHPAELPSKVPCVHAELLQTLNPSMTNVHYTLQTQKFQRVVFDTGSAVSISPGSQLRMYVGELLLQVATIPWHDLGSPDYGHRTAIIGLDAMQQLHWVQVSLDGAYMRAFFNIS